MPCTRELSTIDSLEASHELCIRRFMAWGLASLNYTASAARMGHMPRCLGWASIATLEELGRLRAGRGL